MSRCMDVPWCPEICDELWLLTAIMSTEDTAVHIICCLASANKISQVLFSMRCCLTLRLSADTLPTVWSH